MYPFIYINNQEVLYSTSFPQGSQSPVNGWIELVLIEARDLVAADIRGTSDPYVRIHYGNLKRSTKVRCLYAFKISIHFHHL